MENLPLLERQKREKKLIKEEIADTLNQVRRLRNKIIEYELTIHELNKSLEDMEADPESYFKKIDEEQ